MCSSDLREGGRERSKERQEERSKKEEKGTVGGFRWYGDGRRERGAYWNGGSLS